MSAERDANTPRVDDDAAVEAALVRSNGPKTDDADGRKAVAGESQKADIKKGEPSPSTREPAAEWVALSRLKPWAKNPRKNTAAAVKRVRESIERFGFGAPLIARKANGEIIAGHTRFAAAKSMRLAEVPCRFLDLSEADAHLLALADNRLNELGEWDDAALLKMLGDLRQGDNDAAAVAGWTDDDIDELMKDAGDDLLNNAQPGDAGDQSHLDQTALITCPKCKHAFRK